MADESTKDQVIALHKDGKSAKEIAEALGKTTATVYNHMRNAGLGTGKRGRPRKSDAEKAKATEAKSDTKAQSEGVKTRPRPGSKAAPAEKVTAKASTNGHDEARFPVVRQAIEAQLATARRDVTVLEGMLASM